MSVRHEVPRLEMVWSTESCLPPAGGLGLDFFLLSKSNKSTLPVWNRTVPYLVVLDCFCSWGPRRCRLGMVLR